VAAWRGGSGLRQLHQARDGSGVEGHDAAVV